MELRLLFVGFGVVGQGLAEILLNHEQNPIKVVGIVDSLMGVLTDDEGLNLTDILKRVEETGRISEADDCKPDTTSLIRASTANVIIEATYTNLSTGEPAISHVKAALETGKHVVTTNKGPVALAYQELQALAVKHHVSFRFEGVVMSGTPVLNLAHYGLANAGINAITGILNGTTNYILTEMENGLGYGEALLQAQNLGFAEVNPAGDVDGWDALGKVIILGNVLMNENLATSDVSREGISHLTSRDIEMARKNGKRWKLIGRLKRNGDRLQASVGPEMISLSHPLASISGPINALTFETDLLGSVTIVGPGAGKTETGYALYNDLLGIYRDGRK